METEVDYKAQSGAKRNLLGLSKLLREATQGRTESIRIIKERTDEGLVQFRYLANFNSPLNSSEQVKAEFIESTKGIDSDLIMRAERLQGILLNSYELNSVYFGENGSGKGDQNNEEKKIYHSTTIVDVYVIY